MNEEKKKIFLVTSLKTAWRGRKGMMNVSHPGTPRSSPRKASTAAHTRAPTPAPVRLGLKPLILVDRLANGTLTPIPPPLSEPSKVKVKTTIVRKVIPKFALKVFGLRKKDGKGAPPGAVSRVKTPLKDSANVGSASPKSAKVPIFTRGPPRQPPSVDKKSPSASEPEQKTPAGTVNVPNVPPVAKSSATKSPLVKVSAAKNPIVRSPRVPLLKPQWNKTPAAKIAIPRSHRQYFPVTPAPAVPAPAKKQPVRRLVPATPAPVSVAAKKNKTTTNNTSNANAIVNRNNNKENRHSVPVTPTHGGTKKYRTRHSFPLSRDAVLSEVLSPEPSPAPRILDQVIDWIFFTDAKEKEKEAGVEEDAVVEDVGIAPQSVGEVNKDKVPRQSKEALAALFEKISAPAVTRASLQITSSSIKEPAVFEVETTNMETIIPVMDELNGCGPAHVSEEETKGDVKQDEGKKTVVGVLEDLVDDKEVELVSPAKKAPAVEEKEIEDLDLTNAFARRQLKVAEEDSESPKVRIEQSLSKVEGVVDAKDAPEVEKQELGEKEALFREIHNAIAKRQMKFAVKDNEVTEVGAGERMSVDTAKVTNTDAGRAATPKIPEVSKENAHTPVARSKYASKSAKPNRTTENDIVDELKRVFETRAAAGKRTLGSSTTKPSGTPRTERLAKLSNLTKQNLTPLRVPLPSPQHAVPALSSTTHTRTLTGNANPSSTNTTNTDTSSNANNSTSTSNAIAPGLTSTMFGPRRVRKMNIPPLNEGAVASRDARIQMELATLRAQKIVGGVGKSGGIPRLVEEGRSLSLRALGIVEKVRAERV